MIVLQSQVSTISWSWFFTILSPKKYPLHTYAMNVGLYSKILCNNLRDFWSRMCSVVPAVCQSLRKTSPNDITHNQSHHLINKTDKKPQLTILAFYFIASLLLQSPSALFDFCSSFHSRKCLLQNHHLPSSRRQDHLFSPPNLGVTQASTTATSGFRRHDPSLLNRRRGRFWRILS